MGSIQHTKNTENVVCDYEKPKPTKQFWHQKNVYYLLFKAKSKFCHIMRDLCINLQGLYQPTLFWVFFVWSAPKIKYYVKGVPIFLCSFNLPINLIMTKNKQFNSMKQSECNSIKLSLNTLSLILLKLQAVSTIA